MPVASDTTSTDLASEMIPSVPLDAERAMRFLVNNGPKVMRVPRAVSHGRTAFSLLELVLVLIIIGVVSSVSAIRYADAAARNRAIAAARLIADEIARTKSRANAASQSFSISFGGGQSQYFVDGGTEQARVKGDIGVDPFLATVRSAVCGDDASLVFDGFGIPDSNGSIVVRSGRRAVTIVIDGDTGNCTLSTPFQLTQAQIDAERGAR